MKKKVLKGLVTSFFRVLTPRSSQRRLSILIYHRVHDKTDPYRIGDPVKEQFAWQMDIIANYFRPIALTNAVEMLKRGTLPERAICVTFDDGYRDNEKIALPILKIRNIPATFFITTNYLSTGIMWNDVIIDSIAQTKFQQIKIEDLQLGVDTIELSHNKEKAINYIIEKVKYMPVNKRQNIVKRINARCEVELESPMLDKDSVKTLIDSGMEIGGHTLSHPILERLDDESARTEIVNGKEVLENYIGKSVSLFAYPNGKYRNDYGDNHVRIVKEAGYKAAVSTNWGVSNRNTDLFQLPRFTPWDKSEEGFVMRLLRNYIRLK